MNHYEDVAVALGARGEPTGACHVIGIDPGPEQSGYAVLDRQYRVIAAGKVDVDYLYGVLKDYQPHQVVIESLQSYGMPVGRSVFETAYQIGRILRECEMMDLPCTLIPRPEYGGALCGGHKVTDSLLRQALLLRFGPDTKGGPLALLKGCSDKRSAFAVAVYWLDLQKLAGRRG